MKRKSNHAKIRKSSRKKRFKGGGLRKSHHKIKKSNRRKSLKGGGLSKKQIAALVAGSAAAAGIAAVAAHSKYRAGNNREEVFHVPIESGK